MKFYFLLLIVSSSMIRAYCQNNDELAIKQLLEKESATWRAGDIKGHADCWVVRPYSRILVSTADGIVQDVSPDIMINPQTNIIGKGGSSINTNYKMNISGNNAWVSHDEESTTKDGAKAIHTNSGS